jgi:hypothetical protein
MERDAGGLLEFGPAALGAEDGAGHTPEHRVASDVFAAFDRFQKEAAGGGIVAAEGVAEFFVGGDGRVLVGEDLANNGNEIAVLCALEKFGEGRGDHEEKKKGG